MVLSLLRPRFSLCLGDLKFCKTHGESAKKQTNKNQREREKEERKVLELGFNLPLQLTTGTLLNLLIAVSFHFSNQCNATEPGSFATHRASQNAETPRFAAERVSPEGR